MLLARVLELQYVLSPVCLPTTTTSLAYNYGRRTSTSMECREGAIETLHVQGWGAWMVLTSMIILATVARLLPLKMSSKFLTTLLPWIFADAIIQTTPLTKRLIAMHAFYYTFRASLAVE